MNELFDAMSNDVLRDGRSVETTSTFHSAMPPPEACTPKDKFCVGLCMIISGAFMLCNTVHRFHFPLGQNDLSPQIRAFQASSQFITQLTDNNNVSLRHATT